MALPILELTKFGKVVEELATPLDRWLYFLRHAPGLDTEAVPGPLSVPEVLWALGDLEMISRSRRDRERYEAREKMQRDVYTALAEKLDEGRELGLEEGRAQGRQEGRQEGEANIQIRRIQSLQRLLREQVKTHEELKGLSLSDLESLSLQLEGQLDARLRNGS